MDGIFVTFLLLLGIVDPLASLAAFLSLTSKDDEKDKRRIAIKAVAVAAIVFFIFAIGGQTILGLLGVSLDSFKAAGGIILILLGIQMSLGFSFPKEKGEVSEVAVVIGTPLICGPATIATAMILANTEGLVTTVIAGTGALLATLVVLLFATFVSKRVGRSGLQIMSTMMGIITMAWGLQFLLTGLKSFGAF